VVERFNAMPEIKPVEPDPDNAGGGNHETRPTGRLKQMYHVPARENLFAYNNIGWL